MKPFKNAEGIYEVVIDDTKYNFSKWGTERSLDVLIDLADIAGEFLAKMAAMVGKKTAEAKRAGAEGAMDVLSQDIAPDVLGGVAKALCTGMSKDKPRTLAVIRKLATDRVSRNNLEVNYDLDFSGKLPHLLKLVKASLEVQYGDFSGAIKEMAAT